MRRDMAGSGHAPACEDRKVAILGGVLIWHGKALGEAKPNQDQWEAARP
jgi:hypothetical protein